MFNLFITMNTLQLCNTILIYTCGENFDTLDYLVFYICCHLEHAANSISISIENNNTLSNSALHILYSAVQVLLLLEIKVQ